MDKTEIDMVGGVYHVTVLSFDIEPYDPCPCGSGEKYEKLHSSLGAVTASIATILLSRRRAIFSDVGSIL